MCSSSRLHQRTHGQTSFRKGVGLSSRIGDDSSDASSTDGGGHESVKQSVGRLCAALLDTFSKKLNEHAVRVRLHLFAVAVPLCTHYFCR
jgi:hypothetical protein